VALEDKPVEADVPLDGRVAAAVTSRLEGGRLACAAACEAAIELGVPPLEVGRTADRMQVRLTACQLGLFGYPGHAKAWEAAGAADPAPPDGLTEALLVARSDRGEISCARLWCEAERFSVPRVQAGWLADRLGIKVRDCHLGTF
jgi:hypothetical protein